MTPGPKNRASRGRQSLYYLGGAALQGLGSLLIQPFSIRVLDTAGWGRVGLSTVILQLGQVILSAGLPLAITRAFFNPEGGPLHARGINGANILVSVPLSLATAFFFGLTLRAGDASFAFVWAIIAVGLLSTVVSSQSVLRAQQRPLAFVMLSGGSSLGSHALGLLAILVVEPTATVYLLAFCIGMTATAVAGFLMTKPVWPGKAWTEVKEAFRLGLPVMPHSLAIILLMQGDSFLLQFFQNEAAVGRYLAAAAFALGPFSILAGLNNVWTPRIMAASHGPEFRSELKLVSKQAAWIGAAVAISGSMVATVGIHILKGSDPEVVQLAKVLPTVATGYALYLVAMAAMFAVKRTAAFALATPLLVILAGLVAWIPAKADNLVMLGVVKSATFAALGILFLWMASQTGAPRLPLRSFITAILISCTISGLLLYIPTTLADGIWILVVATCVVIVLGFFYRRNRKSGAIKDVTSQYLKTNN